MWSAGSTTSASLLHGPAAVGIVLGIEVSRPARNNADWYQTLAGGLGDLPVEVAARARGVAVAEDAATGLLRLGRG